MTPLGGSKRVIRKSASGHCWMAWSPDGKLLAYSDEEDGNNGIFLMSSTGSDSHRLTTAPQKTSEKYPAFSPDSQQIAFVRESTVYGADIYAVPVSRGESRRVTFLNAGVNPPVWTRNGKNIVFSLGGWIDPLYATVTADGKKWMTGAYMVSAGGGEPQRLPLPHSNVAELTISVKGDKIAYSKTNVNVSIWKVTLPNSRTPVSKFIASQSLDAGGDFSPDGNADGSDPIRLTTLHTGGSPACSRDGTHIIFDNRISGHSHLYSIKVDDHAVEQLTEGDFDDVTPAWSADGKSIYFSSDRAGKWEVWNLCSLPSSCLRLRSTEELFRRNHQMANLFITAKAEIGSRVRSGERPARVGLEELVTREPSNDWRVRPEGIYFTDSGAEELVTHEPGNDRRVSAEGIYLIGASDKTSKSYPVLKLFSFATRRAKIVGRLDKAAAWTTRNLAISPDGRVALYTQFDAHSQVVMVAKGLQL